MPIFLVKSVKIYTAQKKFTRTPSVASVTNIRYGAWSEETSHVKHTWCSQAFIAAIYTIHKQAIASIGRPQNMACNIHKDTFIEQKLNCGEIFSRVVFLFVTMCGYPAMMPDPELDFMLPTDISIALCGWWPAGLKQLV